MTIDRRHFLKSLGIIGSTSAISCNRMAPEETLSAYLTPPVEMIPGQAAFYATICRACPAGCGILVKTREARPIKLEGNPEHPINRGTLCARGQAFIQGLYSRQRVQKPMLRQEGSLVEVSWQKALDAVTKKMHDASSSAFLTGLESGTFEQLVSDVGEAFGGVGHVMYEPMTLNSMAAAVEILYGEAGVPRLDLTTATQVVSLGADFLDAWLSPVELSRQWAEGHGMAANRRLQMDYIGPRGNLTATAADRYFRLSAGDTQRFAVALLHGVYEARRATVSKDLADAIKRAMDQLGKPPELSKPQNDILASVLSQLSASKTGVVLFGGSEVLGSQATAIHLAVLLTNELLGAMGPIWQFDSAHAFGKSHSEARVVSLLEDAAKGRPEVLFVYGTNPVYTLPAAVATDKLLEKAPFVVSFAAEMDETVLAADVVLPVHHSLESWGDYRLSSRISGLMQPVRAPLYKTRHVGDLLIELSTRAGKKLPHPSYKDYLVAAWSTGAADPTHSGEKSAIDGGVVGDTQETPPDPGAKRVSLARAKEAFDNMLVKGGQFVAVGATAAQPLLPESHLPRIEMAAVGASSGIELIVPLSSGLYDGRFATLDWLREVPDSITQTAWEIPVEVARNVAVAEGLQDGDTVALKSAVGEARATVLIEDGLVDNTVALRPGGGRSLSRYSEGTANPMGLLAQTTDAISGEIARAGTTVEIEKVAEGELVSVMGSADSEGRLLALAMSLDDVRRGQFPVLTRHGEVRPDEARKLAYPPVPMPHDEKGDSRPSDSMYPLQKYPDHRWGLVIDLDRCTGCGACAVACYAENNVPVVGKPEVHLGRELSWLRIEKHVFGRGANRQTRFLPVMCQQCDNAPCETVCPVFAASHTNDGLNAQIYNRCIGTRYCSNNCPYKVRRFNYFDYKREKPANQQLNPDVTVRSRGVMEKCTFCIQRIREAQNRAKLTGRALKDGEIVPACAQTCPTGALSFGDFKQPNWAMTRFAKDPRGYRLLDYMVNTRPGVVYLRKVNTVVRKDKA